MEQYIKKSALLAEIERRYETNLIGAHSAFRNGKIEALREVKDSLHTLEAKEVDLEKEINTYISNNFFGSETLGFFANRTKGEPDDQDIALCAQHFFELGLKAQKGEEV